MNNKFSKDTDPNKIKPEWQQYVKADKINKKWEKFSSPQLAEWLYNLVSPYLPKPENTNGYVLDIGTGEGVLKKPWKTNGYNTIGIDIEEHPEVDLVTDFLTLNKTSLPQYPPLLIILCFPFHKSMPEKGLDKVIELFGKEVPIVFWTTPRFRLCAKVSSGRCQKFLTNEYPQIEGIISIADEVSNSPPFFQEEVYLFNLGLKGHWFYPYNK